MSEIKKDSRDFIGYDYKEIPAGGERNAFYLDCYQCFGWSPDGRNAASAKGRLVLRRERKIANKTEPTRLQRHFEACMEEIRALERSKTENAMIAALIVGLIGTAFMACAVFAVVHTPPMYAVMTVMGILGLAWIFVCRPYRRLAGLVAAGLTDASTAALRSLCRPPTGTERREGSDGAMTGFPTVADSSGV